MALKEGAKLLFCVNPLAPYDAELAAKSGRKPRPLAERGLLTVLSQTFRSLVYSRMRVGMGRYAAEFPDADVVLFEPARDDDVIFFANIFSYSDRRRLAEHAYRHTLQELERRADELGPILARHGVEIDREALKGRLPRQRAAGGAKGLWDSVHPLELALGNLERAFGRGEPEHPEGGNSDAAKAAPQDARAHP